MKKLNRGAVLALLITAAMLPWSAAQALETFEKAGRIVDVNSSQLTISGQVYRLRSSSTLVSADPSRHSVADLRPGDRIYVKGILLNGRYYVDQLVYLVPDPS